MANQTVPAKNPSLTASQVAMALEQITMKLLALERISILLQCEILKDERDQDAMHTVTQSVLQSASFIAEKVAQGVYPPAGIKGTDPMEWFMPPLFFPDKGDTHSQGLQ